MINVNTICSCWKIFIYTCVNSITVELVVT
jgi:hypothetical protein